MTVLLRLLIAPEKTGGGAAPDQLLKAPDDGSERFIGGIRLVADEPQRSLETEDCAGQLLLLELPDTPFPNSPAPLPLLPLP